MNRIYTNIWSYENPATPLGSLRKVVGLFLRNTRALHGPRKMSSEMPVLRITPMTRIYTDLWTFSTPVMPLKHLRRSLTLFLRVSSANQLKATMPRP